MLELIQMLELSRSFGWRQWNSYTFHTTTHFKRIFGISWNVHDRT